MKAAIWQGFDHFWENDPHRVNLFASCISARPDANVTYQSGMSIGRFPPDICHAVTTVHQAGTPTTGFIDGEVTLDVSGAVGEGVERQGDPVTHVLPRPGLRATVLLRGFSVETINFPHGFHTRGFGFLIDRIRQQEAAGGTRISFVPSFFMFPDRSPDPSTDPDRLIWRAMPVPDWLEPRAPPTFEYRMTLYYRILYDDAQKLAFKPHRVVRTAKSHDYPVRYPGPDPRVEVQGVPGDEFNVATVGLQGFRFELCRWPHTRYQGRYLRKLKMMVEAFDYDPESGRATFMPGMLFTNYGVRGDRRTTGEQRRRWLAFVQQRGGPYADRLRALTRLLLGSFGFEAQYTLDVMLIQFRGGEADAPRRMHNVIRSRGPGTRAVRSILRAVKVRASRRRAVDTTPSPHPEREAHHGTETLP